MSNVLFEFHIVEEIHNVGPFQWFMLIFFWIHNLLDPFVELICEFLSACFKPTEVQTGKIYNHPHMPYCEVTNI